MSQVAITNGSGVLDLRDGGGGGGGGEKTIMV